MSLPSERHQLDIVAIHMALLKTGKVLMFGPDEKDYANINKGKSRIWNPNNPDTVAKPPIPRNLFCSGHCFLPDGRLLVAGGQSTVASVIGAILSFLGILQLFVRGADHDIHTFDPNTESWTRYKGMPRARWYPTCVTLRDGRALIVSGEYSQAHSVLNKEFFLNKDFEIFDPKTDAITAPRFFHKAIDVYPFLQVLPGGTLFVHSGDTTRLLNLNTWEWHPRDFKTSVNGTRTYPGQGACVLLPLLPEDKHVRILAVGGSTSLNPTRDTPATNTVEIFEYTPRSPSESIGWKQTTPMSNPRFMSDAILLPDGTILVVNGAGKGKADHSAVAVKDVELFNPSNRTWATIGKIDKARLYHSTALLLPDGRVLVAGSTGHDWPPSEIEMDIEVLSPPYLSDEPSRPVIDQVPSHVSYNDTFTIRSPDAQDVESVVLIRPTSTTHTNNMDQRYVGLSILERSQDLLKVKAPEDATYAPPSFYMLFLVNSRKIPSIAKFIQIIS